MNLGFNELDFIADISDAQTEFTIRVIELCERYGKDIQDTLEQAGAILSMTAHITAKRHKAFDSIME